MPTSAHSITRRIAAVFLAAMTLPVAASAAAQGAAGASPHGAYAACQADARNAIERAACMSIETDAQQQRLDAAFAGLTAALDDAGRAALIASQAAWRTSTTQDAKLEAELYGATQVENLESGEAELVRLRARADQLARYLRLID